MKFFLVTPITESEGNPSNNSIDLLDLVGLALKPLTCSWTLNSKADRRKVY